MWFYSCCSTVIWDAPWVVSGAPRCSQACCWSSKVFPWLSLDLICQPTFFACDPSAVNGQFISPVHGGTWTLWDSGLTTSRHSQRVTYILLMTWSRRVSDWWHGVCTTWRIEIYSVFNNACWECSLWQFWRAQQTKYKVYGGWHITLWWTWAGVIPHWLIMSCLECLVTYPWLLYMTGLQIRGVAKLQLHTRIYAVTTTAA